jgi:ketosteroid isomerase-like protein
MARQQPAETRVRTADKAVRNQPSAEGPLALSRQQVAQALSAAGFLGLNGPRCKTQRQFTQGAAKDSTSDVNLTINFVRAALNKHGFCSLASSGAEEMEVFVEPNEQQTGESDAAKDWAATVEATKQLAARTARQIRKDEQTAEGTQAHVSGDVAVKLLA